MTVPDAGVVMLAVAFTSAVLAVAVKVVISFSISVAEYVPSSSALIPCNACAKSVVGSYLAEASAVEGVKLITL